MRRLLILLFSVSLLAAACGDDDSDSSADDDAAADDTSTDDDSSADDTDGDDSADDTDAGDADDDSSGEDDAPGPDDDGDDAPTGEGVGSDFCSAYNASTDEDFNPFTLSPAELESWYRDNLDMIDGVRRSAPGEIRDDADTLFASFVEVVDALDALDWNFAAIDPTDPAFDNPEAEAASTRIDAFCDDGTDDPAGDLPIEIPGLDPDDLDDLQDQFQNADPEEIGLQFYELLGHDEETARCLLDELGADFDFDDAGADILSQEFCGLTFFEILGTGVGS